jgi:PKD repeat protein
VYYFVRDAATKKLSPMKRSVVYKDKPGNNAPNAFNLTSPSDGSVQTTLPLLQWEETTDPDGDPVTYTVMISQDNTFATVDYMEEEIEHNAVVIDSEAGLEDLTTYYWKVVAVDAYGKETPSNQVWSFDTDDTNGLPGYIYGYITDISTGSGIAGATAKRDSNNDQDDARSDGYYLFSTAAGTDISVTATVAGYNPRTKTVLSLAEGGSKQLNFKLTSTDSQPVAGFSGTPVSGDALLTVDFTDMTAGGDAPLSYQWDFDNDGSVDSTLQNPSANYYAGTYTVKLTVTDFDGDVDTLTRTDYISVCYSDVSIGSTGTYTSMQDAYNDASSGNTIQGRDVTINENINLNRPVTVTIQGGYNCDHTAVTGKTTITGNMTISDGTVTMENIQVQ